MKLETGKDVRRYNHKEIKQKKNNKILRLKHRKKKTAILVLCRALFSRIFVVVQLLNHVWLFVTHGLQHARLLCPLPSPGVCSDSCPLSQWCFPTKNFNRILIFSDFYFNDNYFFQAPIFHVSFGNLTRGGLWPFLFHSEKCKLLNTREEQNLIRKAHILVAIGPHWPIPTGSTDQAPEQIIGEIPIWSLRSFPKAWMTTMVMPFCQSSWLENQCKIFTGWYTLSNKVYFSFEYYSYVLIFPYFSKNTYTKHHHL